MAALDDRGLDHVRTLFGALHDAEQLRTLPLARAIADAIGEDIRSPRIRAAIRAQIDAAVETLDPRARTIVLDCDIAGKTHRTVAAELGIGERYFYRERRRALAELLPRLTTPYETPISDVAPGDMTLSAATALRNAGRHREAVALLAAAFSSESPGSSRIGLAVRLAQLAADAGKVGEIARWLAHGRGDLEALAGAPAEAALAQCELDLAEIRADLLSDEFARAERRARGVARRLRLLATHRHRDRIAAALCEAHLSASETQVMRGKFSEGLAWALEGRTAFQNARHRSPAIDVSLLTAIAQARVFALGSLARAETDFGDAYARAVNAGLPGEAAKIAASFALILSSGGDHQRAGAFVRSAQRLGSRFLTPSERIALSIDLAVAALAQNDLVAARTFMRAAQPQARGLLANVLVMIDAEIHFASGQADSALVLARQAVRELASIGNNRLLGSAHRIEAECLAAVGERSGAADRISSALECLNEAGNVVSLSRAFAVSARVTGNRRHRDSARELAHGLTPR